jgi:DNA-directed RNA polymerase subunit L
MPAFYVRNETHTLASALRPALEAAHPDELVAVALVHPLDDHIRILAPSAAAVRAALLDVKAQVAAMRTAVLREARSPT